MAYNGFIKNEEPPKDHERGLRLTSNALRHWESRIQVMAKATVLEEGGSMNGVAPLRVEVVEQALYILETVQQTTYVHDPYIDADTGIYDVDCSAFLSYILGQVAPNHPRLIPKPSGEVRLLAHDYYNFFSSLSDEPAGGWRPIVNLADALPGDLIAWALPQTGHGDTGHCFVVAEQPVAIDATTMAVSAYDASDILHYDDSRGPGPDQFQTGVGSGTFHLQVSAGTPVAFQFGPGDPVVPESIAIARIERF
jgi:hypothetical protein